MGRAVLWKSGREVRTLFDLLGKDENDLTAALGWMLALAPRFAGALGSEVFGHPVGEPTDVYLQRRSTTESDITDIEVIYPEAHVIIEAKQRWSMPRQGQLSGYAERLKHSRRPMLVALTEASDAYASVHLPKSVKGVPVQHRSWRAFLEVAQSAHGQERRLLRDLVTYLQGVTTMRDPESNRTYVVSLGRSTGVSGMNSIDRVTKKSVYLHPYGPRWPREAPNYLGFRWGGHLREVRHVESYELVDDLHDRFGEYPAGSGRYMVYKLGPVIGPEHPIPNGAQYRASRLWVALDLLLTSATVAEALAATKTRTGVVA